MQHPSSFTILRRCLGYFKAFKLQIIIAFMALAVAAAATAATTYLVQPALDDIFINKNRSALVFVPLALVFLFMAKGLGIFIQKCLMSYCALKVLDQLRRELYNKIICLPVSFFHKTSVGMLMSRIINDVGLISQSLPDTIKFFQHLLTAFGLVGMLIYRDPKLAFIACIVFPAAFYPIIYLGRKIRKTGRRLQTQLADISSSLQENFNGLNVIKAFSSEEREKDNFANSSDMLVRIGVRETIYNQIGSPLMEFLGATAAGLVIWYGGQQVIAGHKTPGEFFSFLTALLLIYEPLKGMTRANAVLQKAVAGAERVFELIDSPAVQIEQGGKEEFVPPLSELVFSGVRLTYPGAKKSALHDIDLHIKHGEKVAFVGQSGAGKTSLLQLVPRFCDPQSGAIILNEKNLHDYTLHSLRTNIGIVSQEAFLFNMSVRDNIAYSDPNAPRDKIEQAARAAYAHDFICQLPEGYDTVIGERGVKLSGGQKQRLTIARAILKNPTLLILDEATSALDSEAERIVQQALNNLMQGRTSLIIAHRLSTILNADKIVVMREGEILDIGPHEQLLASCPEYKKLYNIQFYQEN